jgi:hypothetical protein
LRGSSDDEINLAVQVQGLGITVSGPSARALDFLHRLSPQYQGGAAQPATASISASASPGLPDPIDCPAQYLALAKKLSAASVKTPEERVKRVWLAGQYARAELSGAVIEEPVIALDLLNNVWAVLRGRGISKPKIMRSQRGFKELLEARSGFTLVGHGFPSETEARRVYIAGAGLAPRH